MYWISKTPDENQRWGHNHTSCIVYAFIKWQLFSNSHGHHSWSPNNCNAIRQLSTVKAQGRGAGWKGGPWNILENLGGAQHVWRFIGGEGENVLSCSTSYTSLHEMFTYFTNMWHFHVVKIYRSNNPSFQWYTNQVDIFSGCGEKWL